MAALTAERRTNKRPGDRLNKPVLAAATCFGGGMAALDSGDEGLAQPASIATGLVVVGKFVETVDNALGADGDLSAEIETGVFLWENSAAADLIAADDIGSLCYAVDDQTVALTSATATRSVAGRIFDVEADGRVWVDHNIRS